MDNKEDDKDRAQKKTTCLCEEYPVFYGRRTNLDVRDRFTRLSVRYDKSRELFEI
jgi:hypothetical protein